MTGNRAAIIHFCVAKIARFEKEMWPCYQRGAVSALVKDRDRETEGDSKVFFCCFPVDLAVPFDIQLRPKRS